MDQSTSLYVQPGRFTSVGNYDVRFIRQVIAELEQGTPKQEILLKYQLRNGTLVYWVKRYASPQYQNSRKRISEQTKRSMVRAMAAGRMTLEEVKNNCGIRLNATVEEWIARYRQQEMVDLAAKEPTVLSKKKTKLAAAAGNQQVKVLEQQLADAQLKIAALNTLIDVAEEQLKINIRKKPGARQS